MPSILEIGNGEKCPYCDMIVHKDTKILLHMTTKHEDEFMKALFETDNKE